MFNAANPAIEYFFKLLSKKNTIRFYLNSLMPHPINPNKFLEMVVERAFFCKAGKSFIAGHETEDWLEAEWEIKKQCFYWFPEVE